MLERGVVEFPCDKSAILEVCNYHDVIDYEGKVITLLLTLYQ